MFYLNTLLYGLTADNFVTAFYGIYYLIDYVLIYASAGHNLQYIIGNGNVSMLESRTGIPLAIYDNNFLHKIGKVYENKTYNFKKGDLLLMYTDELIEENINFGPYKIYGEYMEKEVLPKLGGYRSSTVEDFLYADLKLKTGREIFQDDICIICVEVR